MKVVQLVPPSYKEDTVWIEEEVSPNPVDAHHRHKEIQITLIHKGRGKLTVGDYSQPFNPGDIYIIGANQPHFFNWDLTHYGNTAGVAHAINIYFDLDRIPETFFLLQELSSVRKFISNCTTGLQLSREYQAHAAMLIQSISSKANLERLLRLFEILHYFSHCMGGWKYLSNGFGNYIFPQSEGKRMHDVFRYTLDNYAENITLHKIASIAHITPHAFCKYFKQHTRRTYNNFLNEVRVNEACKKIISGSYDGLSVIAYKTGFKGASNFNRVFKKTTGMSPSDYKKEYRYKTA